MKKNNLMRKVKQLTAGLLTAGMVLTGAPFGNFVARAATELQPNTELSTQGAAPRGVSVNPNNNNYTFGSSATTAYAFGKATALYTYQISYGGGVVVPTNLPIHGGTNSGYGTAGGEDPFTFNIAAITDEAYRLNWSRGYYSDTASTKAEAEDTVELPTLKSAFEQSWWHGYYAFAKPYRIDSNVSSKNPTAGTENHASGTGADTADPVITSWGGAYNAQPTAATFYGSTTKKALHAGLTSYKNGEVFKIKKAATDSEYVEVRQEVMPSPDDQYIYVKYTVYNNYGNHIDLMIGNESDTMLGKWDDVPIFVTKHDNTEGAEGLHFHNKDHANNNSSHAVFDIISKGKGIGGQDVGMQRRDANDKSENRVWAGSWSSTAGVYHTDWVFSQSRPGYVGAGRDGTGSAGDTAAAFSAYFDLEPHETKTTIFALAIKPYVIYVDPANGKDDTGTGFMGSPVKSIKKAMEVLSTKPYDIKKAYIYIQGDIDNQGIIDNQKETIVIPANRDITIQTADYKPLANAATINFNTVPLYTDNAPIPETNTFIIKRDANFTGALFKVEDPSSTLNFSNIILDGNGDNVKAAAPIVELSAGNVKLKDNTTIQNSNVAKGLNNDISTVSETTPKASAISVEGTGVLTMESSVKPIYINNNTGNSSGSDPKIPAINVSSTVNPTVASATGIGAVRARAINVSGNVNVVNNEDIHTVVEAYKVDADGTEVAVASVPTGATVTTTLVASTTTDPNPKTTITDKTSTTVTKEEHNDSATTPATVYKSTTKVTTSKANVNLDKSMLYVPKGKTLTGSIGVTISDVPNTSDDNDGRPVLDFEGRTSGSAAPYSASNITTDGDGIDSRMGMATANVTDGTGTVLSIPQVDNLVYLKAQKYNFTVTYTDPDGNTIPIASLTAGTNTIPGTLDATNTSSYAFRAASGSAVNIPMPSYTFNGTPTVFDSATGAFGTLTVVTTDPIAPATTPTKGTVIGTTPNTPLDIVISLKKNVMNYKFDSRGGTAVAEVVSPVGTVPSTMPTPARAGYTFTGWVKYTDANNNDVFDTGETAGANVGTTYPPSSTADTFKFYATWTPDGTLYPISTYHKNVNPALTLTFGSEVDPGHLIESVVHKDHAIVPGYIYNSGSATPVSAGEVEPNPAVTAGVPEGHYHISSMPASSVTLNYKYSVDPNATFTFTVRHIDAMGNLLPGTNVVTSQRRAEQSITAMADNSIAGYTYSTYRITSGENDGAAGSYVLGLNHQEIVGGTPTTPYIKRNDTSTGTFVAYMPNQDVSIDYIYTADAGMNLVRRYYDRFTDKIITSQVEASTPSANVAASIPVAGSTDGDKLYGYLWDTSSNVDIVDISNLTGPVSVVHNPSNGDLSGSMPVSGNGVRADYKLSHDASKWRDINFTVANTPNNNGSVDALPVGAPTSFLANDGSTAGNTYAYTFDKLKSENYVPGVTPNRYYKFDGWYLDAAATQQVNGTDTFPTDTAPLTLYAKFVEDPSQWFDINLVAGSNGSISAPATLHIPYDYTWSQITGQLPTATPVANYLFNGWKDSNGAFMQGTSTLTNHATYTAFFSQDPNVFGGIGSITPTGRIGNDGSGEIVIDGTTPGNVYVISDPDGNIVAVVPGDSTGNRTVVPNLIPGAHYNVQEGSPDTQATVGQPVSSVTGTSVSTPQDVYIPTVDNNYNIGYDPENDGMAQIVINPADPDADYALIDENGNVVQYPGSDNGWMTPVGSNPSTVTFNNLNPNETYTVVARKKGDSSIPNPLTKLPDGNQIIANPGDMADAPKYVVETKEGSIVSVGTTSVGNDTYDEAKAGEVVAIHADPINANGKNFLYWQILAGRAVGVSGKITQADYTFTLSNSNIVLKAVYEPTKVAGDDADLTETIRGGSVGEFGLTPDQIPGLAHELTTPLDRSLIGTNGATVEYKVVFNKRDAKTNEKTAVKPVSVSGVDHPDAHTAAYGLDIELERYVNGRLVNNGIIATASNAMVDVIAQLPAEDVDQLDYQLFDVTPDSLGNITPIEVTMTTDVANNAGLIKFTGNLQHSYVLVYSKTFKVTFVDNKPVLDHLYLNDTSRNFYKKFKVRRKENVEDSYYSTDYDVVTAYAQNDVANGLVTPFEDIYGVQYDYVNWSKKEDKLSVYDTTSPVTKRTIVYAYYSDNRKEVAKARVDLGGTIEEAKILTGDPYLKVAEVAELNEAIAHAVETLRQARDLVSPDGTTYLRQANYAELQQAIDALRRLIDKYSKIAADRAGDRNRRTGGASGGGNSSSGRGSKLLTPGEKSQQNTAINENSNVRAFVLGVDGAWETNPVTGGWSFVLNGGTPINDMWGMIVFNDEAGNKIYRWYYFDARSTMATGWVYDSKNGNWYYMNTTEGPELGQMVKGWVKDTNTNKWYYMNDNTGILDTGWHLDKQDGRWYYLNQNGEMLTGWQNIDGKWYYFNTNTPQDTYTWDANAFKWNYLNNSARPYGSMYAGEKTPDGYSVDANGAWN